MLPDVPIMTLTATATDVDVASLQHLLNIDPVNCHSFTADTFRRNLRLSVIGKLGLHHLVERVTHLAGDGNCGIVFCGTIAETHLVSTALKRVASQASQATIPGCRWRRKLGSLKSGSEARLLLYAHEIYDVVAVLTLTIACNYICLLYTSPSPRD